MGVSVSTTVCNGCECECSTTVCNGCECEYDCV